MQIGNDLASCRREEWGKDRMNETGEAARQKLHTAGDGHAQMLIVGLADSPRMSQKPTIEHGFILGREHRSARQSSLSNGTFVPGPKRSFSEKPNILGSL